MGTTKIQPTSLQSPDVTLNHSAVTSPSNTGHASTSCFGSGGNSETRTCRWFGFQSAPPLIRRTLKITHQSSGVLSGPTATNDFAIDYSLDGGSSWISAVNRVNFEGLSTLTFSADLSPGQDISQVQVRDFIRASSGDPGDSSESTATVSGIHIELLFGDII